MLKKIMFTGVLLITISALKANDITPVKKVSFNLICRATDEVLLNRIAADNDFKTYYISNVKFANKIIESKTGGLFLKYIQNSISVDEKVDLFAKMEVKSKREFDEIGINLKSEAVAFLIKFPELKFMSEKEQKELLVKAFRKLSTDKSISIKFVKEKFITLEECFATWMACNTLCAMACTYDPDYNSCMWACTAACAAMYGVCWVIAE